MKKSICLILSILLLQLFGCTPEPLPEPQLQVIPEVVVNIMPTLDLVSPALNSLVDHQNIAFSWNSNFNGLFQFTIAEDSSFNNIVLDTFINQQQLTVPSLIHFTDYHWRVRADLEEETSSFSTHHQLAQIDQFNGLGNVRFYFEFLNTIQHDTTFTEGFQFVYTPQGDITVYSNSFNGTYEFSGLQNNGNLNYTVPSSSGSNGAYLTYHVNGDSISLWRTAGGLGGGDRWSGSVTK